MLFVGRAEDWREPEPDFRANPPFSYWSVLRKWLRRGYGPFAFWIAWSDYRQLLDELEAHRRQWYDPRVGIWW